MDQKKQKIGDVLVAEAVVSYEPARIGPRSIIQRGIPDRSDTSLFNRFINQPNWTFPVGKSRQAIIRKGLVISGEALIDNIETRSKLSSVYPEAIGGEMEGSGLIAATRNKRIPWILVKGVCDHADGNKSTLKHHRQKLAAAAAVSLCEFTLSSSVRFSDSSRSANNLSRSDNPNSWREALFDVYDVKSDPYYLIRGIDSELQQLCASRDVWVCGPSGCGKTNSLLRTATVLNVELTFIDLSGAAGLSTRDIWRAIYDALCERIGSQPKRIGAAPGIPKIIDACLELLETESHRARLVVFDELPLEVKTFAQFFSTAAGFIVACGNRMPRRKLRFAFSTILNPSDLSIFDGKLKSKCKLVPLPQWSENEVADVLRIINETLPHKLDGQDSKTLLKRVGLSVRDLKRALSEFISFGPTHGWNISLILDKYFP